MFRPRPATRAAGSRPRIVLQSLEPVEPVQLVQLVQLVEPVQADQMVRSVQPDTLVGAHGMLQQHAIVTLDMAGTVPVFRFFSGLNRLRFKPYGLNRLRFFLEIRFPYGSGSGLKQFSGLNRFTV